jgi:hypothetical protein
MSGAVLLPMPLSNLFVINSITYSAISSLAVSNVISPASSITAASALCPEPYNTDFEFSSFMAMDGVSTASELELRACYIGSDSALSW